MRPLIGITVGRQLSAGEASAPFFSNRSYAEAILSAGGLPLLLVPLSPADTASRLIAALDGFLLSGGGDVDPARYGAGDHPSQFGIEQERDEFEISLVRAARLADKPLLAICRGCQLVTVALGGTLWQDLPSQRPGPVRHRRIPGEAAPRHGVRVAAGSRLASVFGCRGPSSKDEPPSGDIEISVNSSHHQAPRELAGGLQATGWSEDGTIEGVELPEARFLLGVQWHPEELYRQDPPQLELFRSFIKKAEQGASARPAAESATAKE